MDTFFCGSEAIHEEIVKKVKKDMQTKEECVKLADLYKMFADGTRVQILCALNHGEMCVCDLAALLSMTKSAISHQLKSLRLSNLVCFRKEGQTVYYSLADSHVKDILDIGFEHILE